MREPPPKDSADARHPSKLCPVCKEWAGSRGMGRRIRVDARSFSSVRGLDDERLMLPEWMKSLKNTLSKTLRSKSIRSPHFQKAFFDHVLRSAESYSEKWHYVRENPVRADLVKHWEDWPFAGEMFALEYRAED